MGRVAKRVWTRQSAVEAVITKVTLLPNLSHTCPKKGLRKAEMRNTLLVSYAEVFSGKLYIFWKNELAMLLKGKIPM